MEVFLAFWIWNILPESMEMSLNCQYLLCITFDRKRSKAFNKITWAIKHFLGKFRSLTHSCQTKFEWNFFFLHKRSLLDSPLDAHIHKKTYDNRRKTRNILPRSISPKCNPNTDQSENLCGFQKVLIEIWTQTQWSFRTWTNADCKKSTSHKLCLCVVTKIICKVHFVFFNHYVFVFDQNFIPIILVRL